MVHSSPPLRVRATRQARQTGSNNHQHKQKQSRFDTATSLSYALARYFRNQEYLTGRRRITSPCLVLSNLGEGGTASGEQSLSGIYSIVAQPPCPEAFGKPPLREVEVEDMIYPRSPPANSKYDALTCGATPQLNTDLSPVWPRPILRMHVSKQQLQSKGRTRGFC